jgi:hypothetical protein
VADAFDAMTSDRPYRRALPFERACQEIADGAGSQFDPAVVATFAAIAPGLPDLHASLHGGGFGGLKASPPMDGELGHGGPLARAAVAD